MTELIIAIAGGIIAGIASISVWGFKPENDAAENKVIEKYEQHIKKIFGKLDAERRHKQTNEILLDCFTVLQIAESRKECLQHLITGRSDLYNMLNEMFAANEQGRFSDHYDEYNGAIEEFVNAVLAGGEKSVGCCSSCKGMFRPDEMAECERKFAELVNSPLYKKWSEN